MGLLNVISVNQAVKNRPLLFPPWTLSKRGEFQSGIAAAVIGAHPRSRARCEVNLGSQSAAGSQASLLLSPGAFWGPSERLSRPLQAARPLAGSAKVPCGGLVLAGEVINARPHCQTWEMHLAPGSSASLIEWHRADPHRLRASEQRTMSSIEDIWGLAMK